MGNWNLSNFLVENFLDITGIIFAHISGNLSTRTLSNSKYDFGIVKQFSVDIHPRKPGQIKQVVWFPPPRLWFKCNADGAWEHEDFECPTFQAED
ncbi:hypothetical protein JHK82_027348 [Glycine max]|uniref:Uncharacterized protein n=2 Tax=Glycine subgen. Soja TaxID=1462606 RepID=A0A0R0HQW7_SOYBN|nr:hypothetical protein JHK82_027348 [Glycine max]KAH1137372.1 hypothetical protein GYH30_027387 [Glycine max]